MMPAASNKTEPKSSSEAGDTSKAFMGILDKKVRNIEKRKSRLDVIRSKQAAGDTLEREQQETLKHYDDVVACLEFARDLQKTYNTTMLDIEKQQKKQMKREKQERAASDLKRTSDILEIQVTLDAMGNDSVRDHFKTGKYGAVVLTDDNLSSLDELYKLISPPAAGEEKFGERMTAASEHINCLLEGRDRAVAGTTYKDVMDLLQLIIGCGYFERAREIEEAEVEAGEDAWHHEFEQVYDSEVVTGREGGRRYDLDKGDSPCGGGAENKDCLPGPLVHDTCKGDGYEADGDRSVEDMGRPHSHNIKGEHTAAEGEECEEEKYEDDDDYCYEEEYGEKEEEYPDWETACKERGSKKSWCLQVEEEAGWTENWHGHTDQGPEHAAAGQAQEKWPEDSKEEHSLEMKEHWHDIQGQEEGEEDKKSEDVGYQESGFTQGGGSEEEEKGKDNVHQKSGHSHEAWAEEGDEWEKVDEESGCGIERELLMKCGLTPSCKAILLEEEVEPAHIMEGRWEEAEDLCQEQWQDGEEDTNSGYDEECRGTPLMEQPQQTWTDDWDAPGNEGSTTSQQASGLGPLTRGKSWNEREDSSIAPNVTMKRPAGQSVAWDGANTMLKESYSNQFSWGKAVFRKKALDQERGQFGLGPVEGGRYSTRPDPWGSDGTVTESWNTITIKSRKQGGKGDFGERATSGHWRPAAERVTYIGQRGIRTGDRDHVGFTARNRMGGIRQGTVGENHHYRDKTRGSAFCASNEKQPTFFKFSAVEDNWA